MTDWLEQFVCLGQRGPDMDEWVNVLFIAVVAVLWIVGGLIKSTAKNRAKGEGPAKEQGGQRQESWQQRLMRKAEEIQRLAEARRKELADRASRGGQGGAASPSPGAGEQPGVDGLSLQKGRGGEAVMVYDAGQARRDVHRPQQPTPPPPPGGRHVIRPRPSVSPRPQPTPVPPQQRPRSPFRAAREAIRAAWTPQAKPSPPVDTRPAAPVAPKQETPVVRGLPETMLGPALGRRRPGRRLPTVGAVRSDLLIDYSDSDALRRAIVQYEILGKPLALRDPLERTAAKAF